MKSQCFVLDFYAISPGHRVEAYEPAYLNLHNVSQACYYYIEKKNECNVFL
jgi:hypothetical protein